MGWSWRIAKIRGIDVKIHATFVLALIWGAVDLGRRAAEGWAYGVFLTLALFALVLAHEFGHAIAAQRYGIKVQDIVLLPIGGVARLNRMPDKPSQELVVALAGPRGQPVAWRCCWRRSSWPACWPGWAAAGFGLPADRRAGPAEPGGVPGDDQRLAAACST